MKVNEVQQLIPIMAAKAAGLEKALEGKEKLSQECRKAHRVSLEMLYNAVDSYRVKFALLPCERCEPIEDGGPIHGVELEDQVFHNAFLAADGYLRCRGCLRLLVKACELVGGPLDGDRYMLRPDEFILELDAHGKKVYYMREGSEPRLQYKTVGSISMDGEPE